MTHSPFVHDEVQSGEQLSILSAPHRNPFALIMPSLLLAGIGAYNFSQHSYLDWCSSVCLSVCLFVCLIVYLIICFFVCMYVCLYVCVFVCMFTCLFACLYVYLFVCSHWMFLLLNISLFSSLL